jgi:hypothetical protein
VKLGLVDQHEAVADVQREHRQQKMNNLPLSGAKHIRGALLAVFRKQKAEGQLIGVRREIPCVAELLEIVCE